MTIYDGTIQIYDAFLGALGAGLNLVTDTFQVLLTTADYTPDYTADATIYDITGEVSGNGYARQTLGSVTYSETDGIASFDFADPVFTAAGGSIVARRWVVFDETTGDLVASGLLNSADTDVEVTDGNTLTLRINASGLFTIE